MFSPRIRQRMLLSQPSVQRLRLLHGFADQISAEDKEEVISYAKSCASRSLDKSRFDFAQTKRFCMSKPLPGLPSLKLTSELGQPKTIVSTLPSGLRVASQETYGQLCTFGILVNVGSRHESKDNQGISHLMETMAFKSTLTRSQDQIIHELESMGANVTTHSSREQILCCIDVLRDFLEPAMKLLSDVILNPAWLDFEIEDQKVVISYQMEEMLADLRMKEAIHEAAYPSTPLGKPHYCTPESMAALNGEVARKFHQKFYTAPNMVLAASGVNHDDLVTLANKYFNALESTKNSPIITSPKSQYTGGLIRLDGVTGHLKEDWTRMCIAFEVGGWNDPKFVPTCVLQTLLGGGDSFSAGGPGKGMYSRLYREVLNRHFWAESAEAFSSMHVDSGLLGIGGAAKPENAGKLLHVFASHFGKLATQHVSEIELSRAKNMLKCNVLTQLESRLVLFEDIGRQVLSYGFRESPEEICYRIDNVTAEDLLQVAREAMQKPPSVACIGDDTRAIPEYSDIAKWFSA